MKKEKGSGIDLRANIGSLDKIEIMFLLYSAAHNTVNAFTYASNILFFVFVVVGIASVELMLHTVYGKWKDGRLIGPMKTASLWAGFFALFFSTAGILAHAQGTIDGEFTSLFYHWIMPTSAPVMFLFAFIIQSVDPILKSAQETEELVMRKELYSVRVDQAKALQELRYKEQLLETKARIQDRRIASINEEASSTRVTAALKDGARATLPQILVSMGVPVRKKPAGGKFGAMFSFMSAGYKEDDLRLLKKTEDAEEAKYSDIEEEVKKPGK